MKISLAGEDMTAEISGNLRKVAGMRDAAGVAGDSANKAAVLDLAAASNEKEFACKHLVLLRQSCYVDNESMMLPDGSMGGAARAVRKLFWKILRPVFDWMSHKQNNINAQIVQALDLDKKERDRDLLQLRREIEELKKDAN